MPALSTSLNSCSMIEYYLERKREKVKFTMSRIDKQQNSRFIATTIRGLLGTQNQRNFHVFYSYGV